MYTAEANPETTEGGEDDPYPKFRFIPNFGEQLYTKKRPTLFVFRWRAPNELSRGGSDTTPAPFVTALSLDQPSNIPVLFGQAIFITETRLYATGYEQTGDGKLLGVKGCFNRPSSIWELILPSENPTTACKSVKIGTAGGSCRSPRVLFNNDRVATTLFWLCNPVGGAHASTVSLHVRDLKGSAGDRLLVDVVHDPSAQDFPGLYTEYNLADSPFVRLGDKTFILTQSLWRSRPTLILINAETGDVVDLTPVLGDQPLYSWNLLGTDGARSVICSRSTPTSPSETLHLTLAQDGTVGNVRVLDKPFVSPKRAYGQFGGSFPVLIQSAVQEAIDRLDARVIPIPNRYPVETIVIQSKESVEEQKPFCLTIPHGGPHASSVTSFTPGVLAYALEGCESIGVLLIPPI